jgi:hypothetical protein
MATALATMAKQHTQDHKALAVAMFASGATSKEVEKRTGIKASYVRTLARRVSQKNETSVSVVSETATRFQETGGTIVSTVFQDMEDVSVGRPDRGSSNETAPEAVAKEKRDFRALSFQIVCVLIVVFHAGLIAYDVTFIWGVPGAIAGGLAFLSVIATLIICTDKKQEDVSQDMVWFVWLIDAAAGVVHFRTFNFAVSVKGGMGVEKVETTAFAVFTCLFSAAALYFFRASQFKNLSK